MALSFSSSIYPLNVINNSKRNINKPTIIKSLPSSSSSFASLQSSSLSIKSNRTPKTLSEHQKKYTTPCYIQENTVGIIGGISVLSTLIFLEKFVLWSSKDKRDHIPFIVCSDPQKEYDDIEIVADNLRNKRLFLEEGGANCIVMPCHISHAWYGEISEGCDITFIHMAECVARELREARFRPLEAGSGVRIGIIATSEILKAAFYQDKLYDQGFEVIVPDKSTMEHMINPAIDSLKRKDMKGARNLLRIAIQVLLVKGVNTVILASHELQNILPYDDPLSKFCVDPMDALARSAIRWAKSTKLHKRCSDEY